MIRSKGRNKRASSSEARWRKVFGTLNGFQARLYAADKALDLGRGGISRLAKLTGMSRTTITKAVAELQTGRRLAVPAEGAIREAGAGRKKVEEIRPALRRKVTEILEETTASDPMSLLRWTSKSTRAIAEELTHQGEPITNVTVARCLHEMGYSLQQNIKAKEGLQHPNRERNSGVSAGK